MIPFDLTKKIFRWGAVPGYAIYASEWYVGAFVTSEKRYPGSRWPGALVMSRAGRFAFVCGEEAVQAAGCVAFERYVIPDRASEELRAAFDAGIQALVPVLDHLDVVDFGTFSDADLAHLWSELCSVLAVVWLPTCVFELANYGSPVLLENRLLALIPDASQRSLATEALTVPEELSFYQQEEVALASTDDLPAHARRYAWLRNSYAGSVETPLAFFEERKHALSSDVILDAEQHRATVSARWQEVAKTYALPKDVVQIARKTADVVAWQDERKGHVLRTVGVQDRFLHELARRRGMPFRLLQNLLSWEVAELFQGGVLPEGAHDRLRAWSVIGTDLIGILGVEDTEMAWDGCFQDSSPALRANESLEVQGIVASRGKSEAVLRGRARIVLDPSHITTLEPGDILIAPMTSPEYVFAMKRVAAVVTDAGGITSHAAVVSRELGIPCIVGTLRATHAFKDGEMIQIDAERGVVSRAE